MTTNGRSTVVGVFPTRANAENAINDLHSRGFTDQQIGFIARDTNATDPNAMSADTDIPTGERAAVGAASGGVVGGLVGAAASLLIPGFGPAIAGGILAATLGGIAIGAAAGGVIGALTHIGVPEDEARYYQGEFEAGRILVTVEAPGRQEEAMDTLARNGGNTSPRAYNTTGTAADTYPTDATTNQPGVNYDPARGGAYTANPDDTDPNYDAARGGTYATDADINNAGVNYDPARRGAYATDADINNADVNYDPARRGAYTTNPDANNPDVNYDPARRGAYTDNPDVNDPNRRRAYPTDADINDPNRNRNYNTNPDTNNPDAYRRNESDR